MKAWKKQTSLFAALFYLAAVLFYPAVSASCPACDCAAVPGERVGRCCEHSGLVSSHPSAHQAGESASRPGAEDKRHCGCFLVPASESPALPGHSGHLKTQLDKTPALPAAAGGGSSSFFPSAAIDTSSSHFSDLILSTLRTVILLN